MNKPIGINILTRLRVSSQYVLQDRISKLLFNQQVAFHVLGNVLKLRIE